MLGVDKADDMVEVFVADEEAVVGNSGDLRPDAFVGFVEREVDDAFACGHRRRHEPGFKLEDVLDDGFLFGSNDACCGTRADAREDVFRCNGLLPLCRHPERTDAGI